MQTELAASVKGIRFRDVILVVFLYSGLFKGTGWLDSIEQYGDLTAVSLVVLLVLIAIRAVTSPLRVPRELRRFFVAFVGFCCLAVISYALGTKSPESFRKLLQLVVIGGGGVVSAIVLLDSPQRIDAFLRLTLLIGLLCGMYEAFAPDVAMVGGAGADEGYQWLSRMSFYALTVAGLYAYSATDQRRRVLLLAIMFVVAYALVSGGARQAVVAIAVALGYSTYVLAGRREKAEVFVRRAVVLTALALVVALVSVAFVDWDVRVGQLRGFSRLSAFSASVGGLRFDEVMAGSGREAIYSEAWAMFSQYPFFGVGFGAFQDHSTGTTYRHAHNMILEALSELGLIGLVALILVYFPILTRLFERRALGAMPLRTTIVATLLIGHLSMMMFSGDMGTNRLVFFLAAAFLMAWRLDKRVPQRRNAGEVPDFVAPVGVMDRRIRD